MNEIRFNPITPEPQRDTAERNKTKSKTLIKSFLFLLLIILVAFSAVAVVNFYKSKNIADPNASDYFAFFLSNNQVYFGKLEKVSAEELIISDVYGLQSDNGSSYQSFSQSPRSTFSLVKLVNELHGPTDKMFINRDGISFYEQLRKDSKVVELIMNQKNQ